MASCEAQTFNGITPEKWQILQAKATSNGIHLNGDSGQAERQGFTFTWNYDAASATLTIQCIDRPIWAPCSAINGQIQSMVDSAVS